MKKDKYLVFEADKPILTPGTCAPSMISQLKPMGKRGRHAKAMREGYTTILNHPDGTKEVTHYRPLPGCVVLDQDVRTYFPDSDAVNAALRGLIALIPAKRRAVRKAR